MCMGQPLSIVLRGGTRCIQKHAPNGRTNIANASSPGRQVEATCTSSAIFS